MFSDCEHEVKLVEEGRRITIAYQIVTAAKYKTENKLTEPQNIIFNYYMLAPGPSAPAKPEFLEKIYANIKGLLTIIFFY